MVKITKPYVYFVETGGVLILTLNNFLRHQEGIMDQMNNRLSLIRRAADKFRTNKANKARLKIVFDENYNPEHDCQVHIKYFKRTYVTPNSCCSCIWVSYCGVAV